MKHLLLTTIAAVVLVGGSIDSLKVNIVFSMNRLIKDRIFQL